MSTVLKPLAREAFSEFEIEDTGPTEPVWLSIAGITSLTLQPSSTNTDVGDYDSGAWADHVVAERSEGVQIQGHRVYEDDAGTITRDAGQALVDEFGRKTGLEANVQVRLTLLDGSSIEWTATVELGNTGGNRTAAAEWGATFTAKGAPVVTPAA